MEKEKNLLTFTYIPEMDATRVQCKVESEEDFDILATNMACFLYDSDEFRSAVFKKLAILAIDKDAQQMLKENSVSVPDFNDLLKD